VSKIYFATLLTKQYQVQCKHTKNIMTN